MQNRVLFSFEPRQVEGENSYKLYFIWQKDQFLPAVKLEVFTRVYFFAVVHNMLVNLKYLNNNDILQLCEHLCLANKLLANSVGVSSDQKKPFSLLKNYLLHFIRQSHKS